ncbi:putative transcriptional regulator [Sulfitobacter undariae]|uniref:Putative transcriptional regulator n=1 Tax=Sulfitobacter undariae TaxID=1563671 RepID=A0A7W6ECL8_9RHOB|nr:helix-turn-helix domain-containing protein [Sulfitobacter undariae]MBB3996150.1 putative transcriptional regulator [Sulfitobacter undariae]
MPNVTTPQTTTSEKTDTKSKRGASSTERIFSKDVTKYGYVALPNILVRGQARLGLSTTQFNILAQLLSYWIDPERPPFPSKADLARRMNIHPTTVRINIATLEEKKLVRREQRKTTAGDWNSNIYHLDGLVDALKNLAPEFEEERKKHLAKKALTEQRSRKDETAERARQSGVKRRR